MSTLREVLEARANSGYGVITHTELRTILTEHPDTGITTQERTMSNVLHDILQERHRQNEKWDEQNHPDGTGPNELPLLEVWYHDDNDCSPLEDSSAKDLAKAATKSTDEGHGSGYGTWADILLEEVFEALAESDPAKLRTELIQVAAVATQWVEAIDRRNTKPTE